jgi:hypothetical protein
MAQRRPSIQASAFASNVLAHRSRNIHTENTTVPLLSLVNAPTPASRKRSVHVAFNPPKRWGGGCGEGSKLHLGVLEGPSHDPGPFSAKIGCFPLLFSHKMGSLFLIKFSRKFSTNDSVVGVGPMPCVVMLWTYHALQ